VRTHVRTGCMLPSAASQIYSVERSAPPPDQPLNQPRGCAQGMPDVWARDTPGVCVCVAFFVDNLGFSAHSLDRSVLSLTFPTGAAAGGPAAASGDGGAARAAQLSVYEECERSSPIPSERPAKARAAPGLGRRDIVGFMGASGSASGIEGWAMSPQTAQHETEA
jgi:hypothetical protein